jgi:hypothetical protein
VLVAHFLDRGLCPAIAASLRPGGVLFYQTFSRESVTDRGPSDPNYRVAPNELLGLFPGLIVRAYRDEGRLGDTACGIRDLALFVAQRAADNLDAQVRTKSNDGLLFVCGASVARSCSDHAGPHASPKDHLWGGP